MTSEQLRRALQEITDNHTRLLVSEQIGLIEGLKSRYLHSIRLLRAAVPADQRTWNFNCHAFAFGLSESDDFWRLREERPAVWPTGEFVCKWLLPAMQLITEVGLANSALVLYFDDDRVTHLGTIQGGMVQSKWGSAHTWEHRVFEVPISFGSTVRYYQRPDLKDAVRAYVEFASAA